MTPSASKARSKPCYQGCTDTVAMDLEVARSSVFRLHDFVTWSATHNRPLQGNDGGPIIDLLSEFLASDETRAIINRAFLADDSIGTRHSAFGHAVSLLTQIPGVTDLFRPPTTPRGPSPIAVESHTPTASSGKGKAKEAPAPRSVPPKTMPVTSKKALPAR